MLYIKIVLDEARLYASMYAVSMHVVCMYETISVHLQVCAVSLFMNVRAYFCMHALQSCKYVNDCTCRMLCMYYDCAFLGDYVHMKIIFY